MSDLPVTPPELPVTRDIEVVSLLASPLHRYEGRPADGPLAATGPENHDRIEVKAGLGIVGDRHFGHPAHVTSSATVMAIESLEHVASELGTGELHPAGTRRNIILRGADVDSMLGEVFAIDAGDGPVLFRAHRAANPCAWMDEAFGSGARDALRGRGGVRCEPLSSGTIAVGPAVLRTQR